MAVRTWYLSLVIFINRCGTMVIPFMTIYTTQTLHFSLAQSGIVMALFGLGSILGAYIGGRLTDHIGFYAVQLMALFGGGIMFMVLGFLTSFPALCVGALCLSTINESFRPANSTAIAYYSKPESRVRSYSLNRLAVNLAWGFGGGLGGLLAAYNIHWLFWVDGLTNVLSAVLLIIVLPVPAGLKASVARNKKLAAAGTPAYKDRSYLSFLLCTVLFAFCFFQMFTILPVYLKTQLMLSERQIGLLMAINGVIIAFVEMVIVYTLEARNRPLTYMKYGTWLVGVSFALYNCLSGQFAVALISMLIITVGEMLSMPFMNSYWISRSAEHNRGQYAALYTMAWGIGQIASPSLGGYLADGFGYSTLWWTVLLVTVIAGIGFSRLKQV